MCCGAIKKLLSSLFSYRTKLDPQYLDQIHATGFDYCNVTAVCHCVVHEVTTVTSAAVFHVVMPIFLPAKEREYVFTGVGLCVCMWSR